MSKHASVAFLSMILIGASAFAKKPVDLNGDWQQIDLKCSDGQLPDFGGDPVITYILHIDQGNYSYEMADGDYAGAVDEQGTLTIDQAGYIQFQQADDRNGPYAPYTRRFARKGDKLMVYKDGAEECHGRSRVTTYTIGALPPSDGGGYPDDQGRGDDQGRDDQSRNTSPED